VSRLSLRIYLAFVAVVLVFFALSALLFWTVDDGRGKRWLNGKIAVSLVIMTLMVGDLFLKDNRLALAQLLSSFLFLSFTLHLCWRQVMFRGMIDGNKIVGAICIYLLLGLIWSLLYLFMAQTIPGAFNGLEQVVWYDNFANAAYYSFVTLTTLGYGDISPVTPVARFLVYMEAIVGVFYMAILVASLVGVRISALHSDKD